MAAPRPRSSPAPVLLAAIGALAIGALLLVVLLAAPFGYRAAERSWFFYKHRHNPACVYHEDCLSMRCPPPNGVFCHRDRGRDERGQKGVCVCQSLGLTRDDVTDAGSDGAR